MTQTGLVIAMFGAKGGIGKTTVATNVATALAQETGKSVALADLHLRFGDVAILMDIPVERSIADMAVPEDEITREMLRECMYTHNTGVAILAAPIRPGDWKNIDAASIERTVTLLSETTDYVVLDTGAPFNETVVVALKLAHVVLLVTTTDQATLNDAALVIDTLRSWNFPMAKIGLCSSLPTRPA